VTIVLCTCAVATVAQRGNDCVVYVCSGHGGTAQ